MGEAQSSNAIWFSAARPRTLPAAAAPVILGSAVAFAAGHFSFWPAFASLLGALFIQIGTNFANDLFDAKKGADGPDRIGPVRAVSAGLISHSAMGLATAFAFAVSACFGAWLCFHSGWPVAVIGISSIAAGILYTGGPYPLGYLGLGDIFVFVFFGLIAVTGTVFVQAGGVPLLAWLTAIPAGCLSTAILVVNNVRDRETDVRAGKRTLAVRFGRGFGLAEYNALVAGAFVLPFAIAWIERSPWPLLPLIASPLARNLIRAMRATDGPALNPLLGQTARLLLVFSALEALGIILGAR